MFASFLVDLSQRTWIWIIILLILEWFQEQGAMLTAEPKSSNGMLVVCPGHLVSIFCTHDNDGSGVTRWDVSGTATADCSEIVTHEAGEYLTPCGLFNITMISGSLSAPYNSTAVAIASAALNGALVECYDRGNQRIQIGNITITVLDPPPLPGPLSLVISSGVLTVSWSPPVGGGVRWYVFGVTGEGCGCVSMNVSGDTTSVTCSGWTAAGQTCSFEVRTLSEDCEITSDPVKEGVSLHIPLTPANLSLKPTYHSIDGSIQHIDFEFTGVDAPVIGAGIDPNVTYTVRIGPVLFTGVTCDTTNYCTLRVTGSQLATVESLFTVGVLASNAVGSGKNTTFPAKFATNLISQEIARVDVDVSTSTVTCVLLSSYQETPNTTCSITYGPSSHCDEYTESSTVINGFPNSSLTITLTKIPSNKVFCYTVELLQGSTSLFIAGRSACDPNVLGNVSGAGSVRVPNGVVTYNIVPGSVAVLECDPGYSPQSSLNRTCGSDGHWREGVLSCKQDRALGPCDTGCMTAIAVVVFGVFLVLVLAGVVVALFLCRYKNHKENNKDKSLPADEHETGMLKPPITEEPSTPVSTKTDPLPAPPSGDHTPSPEDLSEQPPTPQLANYADPEDVIKKPLDQKYEGGKKKIVYHGEGELNYASVDTTGFSSKGGRVPQIEPERVHYATVIADT